MEYGFAKHSSEHRLHRIGHGEERSECGLERERIQLVVNPSTDPMRQPLCRKCWPETLRRFGVTQRAKARVETLKRTGQMARAAKLEETL